MADLANVLNALQVGAAWNGSGAAIVSSPPSPPYVGAWAQQGQGQVDTFQAQAVRTALKCNGACMRVCVRACVHACVHACMCECVCNIAHACLAVQAAGRQHRDLRQAITDAARAAIGYVRTPASGSWNATAYAAAEWWRVGPPDFNVMALTKGGLPEGAARAYMRALWHAVHHPNMATDTPAPAAINWFRWWVAAACLPRPPSLVAGLP